MGSLSKDARGNDTIDGRSGFDRAIYGGDPAVTSGITVNMAAGTVTGPAAIGTDTLRSVESVRGTNFADTYVATGFSDTSANAGSNVTFNEFEGKGGDDTITGNGDTQLAFFNATAAVTVDIQAGHRHRRRVGRHRQLHWRQPCSRLAVQRHPLGRWRQQHPRGPKRQRHAQWARR